MNSEIANLHARVTADVQDAKRNLSQVKSSFSEAGQAAKELDNELRGAVANFKATGGDARALANQLEHIRTEALEAAQGISRTSDEYVRLQNTAARATQELARLGSSANEAEKQTRELKQETRELQNVQQKANVGMGLLGKAAGALGGAFAAIQLTQVVGDLYQMGEAGAKAERGLNAVAGGAQRASEITAAMRQATGGLITESEAAAHAASLMSLGLATNAEEAAHFTRIAGTLGSVVGTDLAGGFDALRSAISNQSYDVLDSLGISSGRVREEVQKLRDAGYSLEDAFRTAVLEEAAAKVEKLEDAGYEAGTAIDRLAARARDAAQALGQDLYNEINKVADAAENMIPPDETGIDTATEQAMRYRDAQYLLAEAYSAAGTSQEQLLLLQHEYAAGLGGTADATDAAKAAGMAYTEQTWALAQAFLESAEAQGLSRGEAAMLFEQLTDMDTVYDLLKDSTYRANLELNANATKLIQVTAKAAQARIALLQVKAVLDSIWGGVQRGFAALPMDAQSFRERRDTEYNAAAGADAFFTPTAKSVIERANRELGLMDPWGGTYTPPGKSGGGGGRSAGSRAADAAKREAEKFEREALKAWEDAKREVHSAVTGAMDMSISVTRNQALMAAGGIYQEQFNEAGRQIEDVINRGWESPHAQTWFAHMIGMDEDSLKAQAAQLQDEIADFLHPDKLNIDAALREARNKLTGNRNREAMANQLTEMLIGEGWAQTDVNKAIADTLGVPVDAASALAGESGGAEMVESFATGIRTAADAKAEQLRGTGRTIGRYIREGLGDEFKGIGNVIVDMVLDALLAEAA